MIGLLRLNILSTAYLIPQYLGGVRGFRALQVGDTLLWIAAPQLIICPIAAFMLRRSDPRLTAAAGLCLVGAACILVADTLTPVWGSDQFLVSQLMQAVGQSFALSGIVFTGVLNLRPQDALTFGAMLQIARLFGGEIGQAFVATMVRTREQHASNLIGQHLRIGDADVQQRLQVYGRIIGRAGHPATGAPALLGQVVRSLATTQSVIDTFVAVAFTSLFGLIVLVVLPPPPNTPASHRPLFRRKQPA
jgi:DHA2 family multidrug resistance protein